MQLGMIGLGRMGANMVRRLVRDGHECVVFDLSPDSVKALADEGAVGSDSMEEFVGKLEKPRSVWLMVPAAVVDKTLLAFADHGEVGDPIPADGGDADDVLGEFQSAGVDTDELAARLQREGAEAFNKSWNDLLESIESESRRLAATG